MLEIFISDDYQLERGEDEKNITLYTVTVTGLLITICSLEARIVLHA